MSRRADRLDDLARRHARGEVDRRGALRLLLGGSMAALGGVGAARLLGQAGGSAPAPAALGADRASAPAPAPSGPPGQVAGSAPTGPSTRALNCPPPNVTRPLMSGDDCPDNRTPKDNHTPAVNGCGPQDGVDFVPDDYGKWNFTGPCNNHDVCYGTCGSDKDTCDNNFRDDMDEVCRQTTFFLSADRAICMRLSRIYAGAVSNFGAGPYEAGQIESCDCCEPPGCIYCNCNDTYYQNTQIAQCLDECHVSLGCFTGICEPAACP